MKGNFKRHVDQITQNAIAPLNIWNLNQDHGELSVSENRRVAPRYRSNMNIVGP
jgi:hypothetical protein